MQWLRDCGDVFLCWADEYGTTTKTKAMEENCPKTDFLSATFNK